MDWNNARIVLAIHKAGSLTGAARILDVDQSTVSRRLAAYEEELQARLFDRRDMRFLATPEGLTVIEHAERMESEYYALTTQLRGRDNVAAGDVIITCIGAFSDRLLVPALKAFNEKSPDIRIRILASDANLSLERQEADIALRGGRPESGRMVARKVGTVALRLYAHRSLIEKHGTTDPAKLPWVGFAGPQERFPETTWKERNYPDARIVAMTNTASARAVAICHAVGIGIVPQYLAYGDSNLVALSGEKPVAERELWLMLLPEYRKVLRFRIVADWIAACVASNSEMLHGVPAAPTGL